MDRLPSTTSLLPHSVERAREIAYQDFVLDDEACDIVILLDAALVPHALSAALLKAFAQQHTRIHEDLLHNPVKLSCKSFKIIVVDPLSSNPAAAADNIRTTTKIADLVAFFAENPSTDVTAWLNAGVEVHTGSDLLLEEMVNYLRIWFDHRALQGHRPANVTAPSITPGGMNRKGSAGQLIRLTAREEQVIRLIAAGESNKAIARLLNIEVATVKTHVHNLLTKLDVDRRGKLALWRDDRIVSDNRRLKPDDLTIRLRSVRVPGGLTL